MSRVFQCSKSCCWPLQLPFWRLKCKQVIFKSNFHETFQTLSVNSILCYQDSIKPNLCSNDFLLTEAVVQRCSVKKVFLEISQNSQANTCARVSFYINSTFSYLRQLFIVPCLREKNQIYLMKRFWEINWKNLARRQVTITFQSTKYV